MSEPVTCYLGHLPFRATAEFVLTFFPRTILHFFYYHKKKKKAILIPKIKTHFNSKEADFVFKNYEKIRLQTSNMNTALLFK